jgi:predicted Ser/Thr protein kinase
MRPRSVPSRIDRYEIKSIIGAGGMGTLYLARDTNPNTARLVALKLLNANIDSDEFRQRFGREARALAALNHPNVVNIYDSGEYQFAPYIVMEYVRGETLAEKIKRRAPLTLAEKLKLMMELCAGLAHAHEAGIIHRDIKPANVMIDRSGRVKLLDFGIARAEGAQMTVFGPQMTKANIRIGTPGYMSPEQIDSGEIDRRTDIFAVGVVMYELLSYCEAFTGASTREIEDKVLQSDPAPLKSFFIPGLTPEIEAIVYKALEKDPERRFQDALEFERALERQRWHLGPTEAPVVAPRVTPAPGAPSRKRESAAEVAFQRARACYEDDAVEAAKRFALEALAEDPHHHNARVLLHDLDPRAWTVMPDDIPVSAESDRRKNAAEAATYQQDKSNTREEIRTGGGAMPGIALSEGTALSGGTALGGGTALTAGTALSGGTGLSGGTALGGATAVGGGTSLNSGSASGARTRADGPGSYDDVPVPEGTFVVAPRASFDEPVPDGTFVIPRPAYQESRPETPFVSPRPAYDEPVPEGTFVSKRAPDAPMVSEEMTVMGLPPNWGDTSATSRRPSTPNPPIAARPVRDAAPQPVARASTPAKPPARPPSGARPRSGAKPAAGMAFLSRLPRPGQWQRSQVMLAAGVVATLLVVVAATAMLVRWLSAPAADQVQLNIARPVGGTITGDGIDCGSDGIRCTARFELGKSVTFEVKADEGYRFTGYTGDCAPSGRVTMSEARTCGASFAEDIKVADTSPGSPTGGGTLLLSLIPPTGGTIVSTGINCGTLGKECEKQIPQGAAVKLEGWADKGFTLIRFTGDCAQSGDVQMTAPRTCSAIFSSLATASGAGTAPTGSGSGQVGGAAGPTGTGGGGGGGRPVVGGRNAAAGAGGGSSAGSGSGGGAAGASGASTESGGLVGPPLATPTPGPEKPAEPPPAAPTLAPDVVAKKAIEDTLERYRAAYEAMDFVGVREVYPTAPSQVGQQFRQFAKLEYAFAGPPKYVELDPRGGTALVEMPTKTATVLKVGGAPKREYVTRFSLLKRGADDQWVIASAQVK